jgi:hypothetical protein
LASIEVHHHPGWAADEDEAVWSGGWQMFFEDLLVDAAHGALERLNLLFLDLRITQRPFS